MLSEIEWVALSSFNGAKFLLLASHHCIYLIHAISSSFLHHLHNLCQCITRFFNHFWATVCKTVRPMLLVRCLSVCDVGILWPNGWTDQDETWHAGRPRPWPHCVSWDPAARPPKGHSLPIFGPYLLRPNGCMDQDVTWYAARPGPGDFVLDDDPAPPPQKGTPNFRPMFIAAKRLDG